LPPRCLVRHTWLAQSRATPDSDARARCRTQAIDTYRAVFRDAPGSAGAGEPLALLLLENGQKEAALSIAQRVRQSRFDDSPRSGERLSLANLETLGTVYHECQRYRESVALFREAAERYRSEPAVFYHLGRAQAGLSLMKEAAANLEKAAALATSKSKETRSEEEKRHLTSLIAAVRRLSEEVRQR